MNNQKDIQKTSFNDYGHKGHSTLESLSYKPSITSVNLRYDVLNKKTEKLVTALYMVTDCMETEDSLKTKLRYLGVELLSDTYRLTISSSVEKHTKIVESQNKINEILSFLEIAYNIGFISEMNTNILRKEFSKLISELENYRDKEKHFVFTLKEDMFNVENDIKDKKTLSQTMSFTNSVHNNYIGQLKTNKTLLNNQNDKQDRGEKIVKTIKDLITKTSKKDVSIKDISESFNCSEKTLQRELNELVSKGQIKKIGSKRWSRYEIQNQTI
jgi:hypothetical protein